MPYWDASSLAQEFPQPVQGYEVVGASTSPVNFGGLSSYIAQAAAEFDSTVAGAGYVAPIPTTASSYSYAQMVVGMGARAMALWEIYPSDNAKANRLYQSYKDALKSISDKTVILLSPIDTTYGNKLSRYGQTMPPMIVASMGLQGRGLPRDF